MEKFKQTDENSGDVFRDWNVMPIPQISNDESRKNEQMTSLYESKGKFKDLLLKETNISFKSEKYVVITFKFEENSVTHKPINPIESSIYFDRKYFDSKTEELTRETKEQIKKTQEDISVLEKTGFIKRTFRKILEGKDLKKLKKDFKMYSEMLNETLVSREKERKEIETEIPNSLPDDFIEAVKNLTPGDLAQLGIIFYKQPNTSILYAEVPLASLVKSIKNYEDKISIEIDSLRTKKSPASAKSSDVARKNV